MNDSERDKYAQWKAKSLTRRGFLGLGAAATMVAGVGLAGCSPEASTRSADASEGGSTGSLDASPASSWRIAPEQPETVSEEVTCDVLVIGLGHAGCAAARAAAEGGAIVCAFEQQDEASHMYLSGGQVGHINSEFLASRGVPKVDELVFFNDWMLRHGNRPNPGLIRKYAAASGKSFDWLFGDFIANPESVTIRQVPTSAQYQESINGVYGFVGCAMTGDFMVEALDHCVEVVRANGGTVHYGTTGYLLMTDESGAVTGAYGRKNDESFIKVTARKGVVLSGGGFGSNAEMYNELYTEATRLLAKDEEAVPAMMDQNGTGISLGYWAGGKLDPCIGAMGGNYFLPMTATTDPVGSAPVLYTNGKGKRYSNEGFGSFELAALPGGKEAPGLFSVVFGENIDDYIYSQAPGHMSLDYTVEEQIGGLHTAMETALAAGAEGAPVGDKILYCADDPAVLAEYLGYTGEAVKNFTAAVERYNELCDQGRDEDFGKDPHILIKLEAPYYAYSVEKSFVPPLVTTSGLLVDENSQVVNDRYEPISGLYAAGNNSGSRFGFQYTTPLSGVSLNIAQTQGYLVGQHLASL